MADAFRDKIALVTGGSTGIGAAIALHLASEGAKVLVTGRNEATLKASAARHPGLAYVVADVASPSDAARSIEEVKTRWGRLDLLVNNAGIAEVAPLADASLEHVKKLFDINVLGLVETTRLALPLLERSKGAIVNVASTVADHPFPNLSAYSATKAAVVALTKSWAKELAPKGVRVNAVSPGPVATPIFAPEKMKVSQEQVDAMGASIAQMVPLGRFGKSEEVAAVVAFLSSDASSFVTGAQYTVGGGIEAA
ncbi:MAG: SDR family oxidoreductase [Deltaproteobacteria bacterium]|nr:SDR family oxidoreductase [Deltaproteobacteria bacterium]